VSDGQAMPEATEQSEPLAIPTTGSTSTATRGRQSRLGGVIWAVCDMPIVG
jgi:hypothetical protein